MTPDKITFAIRGGSWGDSPEVIVRATFDFSYLPATRYECIGFRTPLSARQSRA